MNVHEPGINLAVLCQFTKSIYQILFISQFESYTKCSFRSPNCRKHHDWSMQRSKMIRIRSADPCLFPKPFDHFICMTLLCHFMPDQVSSVLATGSIKALKRCMS